MPIETPEAERPRPSAESDPRRFKIKSAPIRAFAKNPAGQFVDLEVRRADVVQGKRSQLLNVGEQMFIAGTASSNVVDRMGDTLDSHCQARMLEQCSGMTIFANHQYAVPEDVLGVCVGSTLGTQHDMRRGGDVLDFDIVVQIDDENPRAVKSWKHVQNGVKLGFSIGGVFTDVDLQDPEDWASGLVVHDIELLEISLVGIPANPRAYTKFISEMTKSFKSNLATVATKLPPTTTQKAPLFPYVKKSLLGGTRPEDIDLSNSSVGASYDATITNGQMFAAQTPRVINDGSGGYVSLTQRAAGTREDANDDHLGNTVPQNPNATPTRDRPVSPPDDRDNRNQMEGPHPNIGPPNADEPPAVPQIGSPSVTGIGQPQEAKPVSPANAAPEPARFHPEPIPTAYQPQDDLHSRPAIHQQEQGAGMTSTPFGGDAVSNADQAGKPREEQAADPNLTKAENESGKAEQTVGTKPGSQGLVTDKDPSTPDGKKPQIASPGSGDTGTKDEASNFGKDLVDRGDTLSGTDVRDKEGLGEGGSRKYYRAADIKADPGDFRTAEPPEPMRVQKQAVKGMRAIVRAVNHGFCAESVYHVTKAHRAMESLLPVGYTVPVDAAMPDNVYDSTSAKAIDNAAQTVGALVERSKSLDNDISVRTESVKKLTAEIANLETKLAELRATPTGRISQSYPGGSIQSGSEPVVSADFYRASMEETARRVSEQMYGAPTDGRGRNV